MQFLAKGGQAAVFSVALNYVPVAALNELDPIFLSQCNRKQRLVVKILRCAPWPAGWQHDLPVISPEAMHRVFNLATNMRHIRSPHVVPYIDVQMTEAFECRIVMPLFDSDLDTWNGNRRHLRRIPEQDLLAIGDQLTKGLVALGAFGISHLDLNTTNVLVIDAPRGGGSDVPHVVLADLEAAYVSDDDFIPPFTEAFAAPERVHGGHQGGGAAVTAPEKLDVWSLGMLLFVLGARHEFPGLVDFPEYGEAFMNDLRLTPSRVAAAVRRDLPDYSDDFVSLVCLMLNHDCLTRPPLSIVADTIAKMNAKEPLSFPLVLGPFELLSLPTDAAASVELYKGSGMYDIHHCKCYCCGEVRSQSKHIRTECIATDDVHLPAHTSPLWPVQGSACWREVAGASTEALAADLRMVFLYPFACNMRASETLAREGRTKELLQLQGGFAVCTADEAPAARSVVVPVYRRPASRPDLQESFNLFFASAQPWPSSLTPVLGRAGRIHAEVPSLLGTTAKCFCWILPGEKFVLPNKEEWVPAPDGGLVFWFNNGANPPHELDRYFPVSASLAPKRPVAAAAAVSSLSQSISSAVNAAVTALRPPPPPVPVPAARGFFLYGKFAPFAPGAFVQYASGIGSKFQIASTGELGRMGETFYMGYDLRRALRAPDAAGYAAFLYADPPLAQAAAGPPQPGFHQPPSHPQHHRALRHHGIVFFHTVSRIPLGMLRLYINDRDAAPEEETDWVKIHTVQQPIRRFRLGPTAIVGQLIPTIVTVPIDRSEHTAPHFVDGPNPPSAIDDPEWERVTGYTTIHFDGMSQTLLLSNEAQMEWVPLALGTR